MNAIRDKALALGFDAVGFAPAHLAPAIGADLREFCAQGLHGDMGWLENRQEMRAQPALLWPEARSVIALALCYDQPGAPLPSDRGAVSVYARNQDYHEVMKKRLRQLARFLHEECGAEVKIFVDTAPVMEKPLAQQAGLGWQGKHTNLVSRRLGAFFFLGMIYTDMALDPDPAEQDHCGACRRCLSACPTDAFLGPYRLDARRCISYLTIEHKGPIERSLRPLLGNRIYGCDDCLAVCPWNKFAQASDDAFLSRPDLRAPDLIALAGLDDAAFRTMFRGSPIKRIGRDRFLRNVLYALGNSGQPGARGAVLAALEDQSPLVRGAAVWALSRLISREDLSRYARNDPDPAVAQEWTVAL
ncbi:MAG TPA: tRNA epoxyqueuosine(34) reductase QueG [Dongiaceae bacterium]|jgi:epoxyqueuosine reductase|nr:tRNA epoxyqueuosine(34) reductase QueG [Dongiaceae bacterium]